MLEVCIWSWLGPASSVSACTYCRPSVPALAHYDDDIFRPQHLGGSNLGISEATVMLETISESGAGVAGAQTIHAKWI